MPGSWCLEAFSTSPTSSEETALTKREASSFHDCCIFNCVLEKKKSLKDGENDPFMPSALSGACTWIGAQWMEAKPRK